MCDLCTKPNNNKMTATRADKMLCMYLQNQHQYIHFYYNFVWIYESFIAMKTYLFIFVFIYLNLNLITYVEYMDICSIIFRPSCALS